MFEIVQMGLAISVILASILAPILTYKYKMEKLKLERDKFEFEKEEKEKREGSVV